MLVRVCGRHTCLNSRTSMAVVFPTHVGELVGGRGHLPGPSRLWVIIVGYPLIFEAKKALAHLKYQNLGSQTPSKKTRKWIGLWRGQILSGKGKSNRPRWQGVTTTQEMMLGWVLLCLEKRLPLCTGPALLQPFYLQLPKPWLPPLHPSLSTIIDSKDASCFHWGMSLEPVFSSHWLKHSVTSMRIWLLWSSHTLLLWLRCGTGDRTDRLGAGRFISQSKISLMKVSMALTKHYHTLEGDVGLIEQLSPAGQ